MAPSFDDPRPDREKRRQQIIYLLPSLRTELDILRAVTRYSRSEFIERLLREALDARQKQTVRGA